MFVAFLKTQDTSNKSLFILLDLEVMSYLSILIFIINISQLKVVKQIYTKTIPNSIENSKWLLIDWF